MGNLREVAARVEKRAGRKLARGTVDLPLPLYDGNYGGRFGVLDGERLAEFEQIREGDITPEQALDIGAELISDACRQILARDERGKWEPLTHDDARPVRFDEEFAEALALEPSPESDAIESGADVVLAVWTVEGDDGERLVSTPALNLFAIRLLEWMTDTSKRIEGELAGGSQARRQ